MDGPNFSTAEELLKDPNPFHLIPLKHTRYALQDLCSYVLLAWDVLRRDCNIRRSGGWPDYGLDWCKAN
jgi:hypothetical protein